MIESSSDMTFFSLDRSLLSTINEELRVAVVASRDWTSPLTSSSLIAAPRSSDRMTPSSIPAEILLW